MISPEQDAEEWERKEQEERYRKLFPESKPEKGDFWTFQPKERMLIRNHNLRRRNQYNPVGSKDLPVPRWALCSTRRTEGWKQNDQSFSFEDEWRKGSTSKVSEGSNLKEWWTGKTCFYLQPSFDLDVWLAAKKGQDEVDLK